MTILPSDNEHAAVQGAQITYREENKTPGQNAFDPAQISSPLGGIEGGEGNYRKPKRIPAARRLTLGDDRRFKNSKNRVTNADRINSYAIKLALDYLNRSFHYENEKVRSLDEVTSHLFSILADRLKPMSDYEAVTSGGKGYMTYPMVERYALRAAEYALDLWRPDFFEIQARKGAKGGRRSKRNPEYTYRDFLAVEGLTHAEAAAMLNLSVSTVRRMRDKFKKPEPVTGDFLPISPERVGDDAPSVEDLLNYL